jgi:hypothetical protein
MTRKGYQSIQITLKDDVLEALDSLGSSHSGIASKLILQHIESLQKIEIAMKDEPPEALICYVKTRLSGFSRQQAADLIVAVLSRLV